MPTSIVETARSSSSGSPAETVAAVATAPGRAAIATVVVRGPHALSAVGRLCGIALKELLNAAFAARLLIRNWNGPTGERIVLRVCDERQVEVHCHGGTIPARTILADLAAFGVRTGSWQELARAQASSRIEYEALEMLTRAPTVRTAAILLDQYRGSLSRSVEVLAEQTAAGRLAEVANGLRQLLARAELGQHLVTPWRVAIVGRPNVGKSSLLNAIVGYTRAIVHEVAGTTRDIVSVNTAVDGWPVEFLDTAGIRESTDEIERAGVARSQSAIDESDRQLVVWDSSESITNQDRAIRDAAPRPILVASKSDLVRKWQIGDAGVRPFMVSAQHGSGIAELLDGLSQLLVPIVPIPSDPVPFLPRHVAALGSAAEAAHRGDAGQAQEWLAQCIGNPAVR